MDELLLTYLNNYTVLSVLVAFAVGIISSLNPCSVLTLPFLITSSLTLSNGLDVKSKKSFIYQYSFVFISGMVLSYSILLLLFSKFAISSIRFSQWFVYLLIAVLTLLIVLYSLKFFKTFNTNKIIDTLLPYKFYGAFLIGVLHGFIASPCGSAPFIAVLTLASQNTWVTSYSLMFSFAIGQGVILLLAALFIGVFQGISQNKIVSNINKILNNLFILGLFFISIYFFYKAYVSL